MQISAIILAAGSGTRTGLKFNKVLYEINGKKVVDYSIDTLKKRDLIGEIILVVSENEFDYFFKEYRNSVNKIVIGGKERQDSVYKALNEAVYDKVLIHDGARPFIPESSLSEIESKISDEVSMTLGVFVKDTIQQIEENRVVKTLNRNELIITQTPQCFDKQVLINAHTVLMILCLWKSI